MQEYKHKKIEKKWKKIWEKEIKQRKSNWIFDEKRALESYNAEKNQSKKINTSNNIDKNNLKKLQVDKKYLLDMFPYPSGSGLHVGHVEEKAAIDIYARYLRMKGENVLMPTGYDSFGLPTENYAIKHDMTPQKATKLATDNFDEQTKSVGISYDWTRKFKTSQVSYYKYTQWWFKFLYERGLAVRKKQLVNWCLSCKTVLANEQVIEGACERCDNKVIQKEMEQWFFKITDYVERLLKDLEKLDWPESTKMGQKNWIGKKQGIEIEYLIPKHFSKELRNKKDNDFQNRVHKGPQKVLLGTQNNSKIKRIKKLIKIIGLENEFEIISAKELNIEPLKVNENKKTLFENALEKAKAYKSMTDLPVLSIDTGLIIERENVDFKKVRRNALKAVSKQEKDISQKEIAQIMIDYYRSIARKYGGEVNAKFIDSLVLIDSDNEIFTQEVKREILLTDKVKGEVDIEFPIRSIYKVKANQKYVFEQSQEEYKIEFEETIKALKSLLSIPIRCFTTRPDTNFGASFIVTAPDSDFVKKNLDQFSRKNRNKVKKYIQKAMVKTELERIAEDRKKTGEFVGLYAINNLNKTKLPIYVSDFVLKNVGTGNVVGVPGHDKRDFEFAKLKNLPIKRVVQDSNGKRSEITRIDEVYEDDGIIINSEFLNGLNVEDAKQKIMDYLEEKGWGKRTVSYKLRDWSISRQRYWGAPIPILYKKLTAKEKELNKLYCQKPDQVLNFHAYESNSNSCFHQFIDKQLEQKGVKSISPNFSGGSDPKLSDWIQEAEQACDINQNKEFKKQESKKDKFINTVVTGRSLGCWAALKFAQKHKIRKLILIAPAIPIQFNNNNKSLLKKFFDQAQIKSLKKFLGVNKSSKGNVDFEKVNKNVSELVVYLSTNDPYIPLKDTEKYFRKNYNQVRIITQRNKSHYENINEFYHLLNEINKNVRKDILKLEEEDLPVKLPDDVDYRPQGEAPLETSQKFNKSINKDKYGKHTQREVDTMDTFVCSSWYYFRFLDPHNNNEFASHEKLNAFGPVDFYIGGAEHTVLHLLYSRFFTKVLYDAGMIDYDEPFIKLRHQGLILAEDNRKMSKRWGNVINPTDIVEKYGADTLRMYEMFMGPLEQMKAWKEGGVRGVRRFLSKVWKADQKINFLNQKQLKESDKLKFQINKLINSIESDIENLKFNTAVSSFMEFINLLIEENFCLLKENWKIFLQLLYPFAPFITSELWERNQFQGNVYQTSWPKQIDMSKINYQEKIELVIMINGKKRESIKVQKGTQKSTVLKRALTLEKIQKYVKDKKQIKKIIFVPDKILNIVL